MKSFEIVFSIALENMLAAEADAVHYNLRGLIDIATENGMVTGNTVLELHHWTTAYTPTVAGELLHSVVFSFSGKLDDTAFEGDVAKHVDHAAQSLAHLALSEGLITQGIEGFMESMTYAVSVSGVTIVM